MEVKTQTYTEIHGKGKRYFSLKYSPETAAGLLGLTLEQLYDFMGLWGRPLENHPETIQGRWNWNVCWLDLVQC